MKYIQYQDETNIGNSPNNSRFYTGGQVNFEIRDIWLKCDILRGRLLLASRLDTTRGKLD